MKRLFSLILVCFSIYLCPLEVTAISVSAECACVLDGDTGRVIYEKNMQKQHTMASTTKIMTALVALENSVPDQVVTVSKKASCQEGTSLYLKAGQKTTMQDLLYGLMLQSGNDAAVAIAEGVAGSVEEFARLMNERAKAIGAVNSSFKNPNGLDEKDHYTTAYDLALITREAMKNPEFEKIVSTKSKTILDSTQIVSNHNKMLRMYDGCIGVKTGFTKKSGRCLVTAAVRDGVRIIAVTLNAPDDWRDHTNMLDYGFETTERFPVILKGMTVNSVSVKNGTSLTVEVTASEDFYITENREEKLKNIKVQCNLPSEIEAPVRKGDVIGKMTILYKNEEKKTIDLIASCDVEYECKRESFWENFKKIVTYGCESEKNIVK